MPFTDLQNAGTPAQTPELSTCKELPLPKSGVTAQEKWQVLTSRKSVPLFLPLQGEGWKVESLFTFENPKAQLIEIWRHVNNQSFT